MNADEILERIRANLRSQPASTPPPLRPVSTDGSLAAELTELHRNADIYRAPLGGKRRLLGPAIALSKRALRRLLSPVLSRQVAYNLANTRLVSGLKEEFAGIGHRQDELRSRLEGLAEEWGGRLAALREELAALRALGERLGDHEERRARDHDETMRRVQSQLERTGGALQAAEERIARTEQKLRRLLNASAGGSPLEAGAAAAAAPAAAPRFDYFGFEARFRGSEHEISERQRPYVEHFRGLDSVLDVGCGRGEFLELLRERGIRATGVDVDLDMVLACREKNLEVIQDDAAHHLETLPDDSLGGIFSAQVIEHLEPERMMELIRLCRRKLRAGGLIVLETINPQCQAGMNAFYLDPSHVKPVHPDMLRFFLQSIEFAEVEVRYHLDTHGALDVNAMTDEWRRANCPDYVAIARK